MEAMPSGALYIFFLSPFFLGITNVLGHSGTGIFQPDERAGRWLRRIKKVSARPAGVSRSLSDDEE